MRSTPRLTFRAALACLALVLVPMLAVAQTDATSASQDPARTEGEVSVMTQQISEEVYSPYCPGKTLAMCPSAGAAEVRRDIQTMAAAGMDKEAIKEAVITKYGEQFRLTPPGASDDLMLGVIIGVGFLLAIFAIWFFTRGRTDDAVPTADAAASDPAPGDDLSAEERAYLDEVRSEYQD